MSDRPARLDIFQTALPMRRFEHAAATRQTAEAVVVCLRTTRGRLGWGEALPRDYVTGETIETVRADLETIFWPILRDCPDEQAVARAIREMPCRHEGRVVTAARCAAELAARQAFELPLPGAPTPAAHWPSVTGVIGSSSPARTARRLRLMRWYGLRSFKLKLGLGEQIDRENLDVVRRQLARGLADATYNWRVDANSAWTFAETPDRVEELRRLGVCAVEQPAKLGPARFVELALRCSLPLIADETLLTEQDAEVLLGAEGRVWLNVRIAKNGGLTPALRLASLARRDGAPFVLGCMVGESGILSTAQRTLLACGPIPLMLEGNYGRLLLKDDLTDPSPRFGYRGRLRAPAGAPGRFDPRVRGDKLLRHGRRLASLE